MNSHFVSPHDPVLTQVADEVFSTELGSRLHISTSERMRNIAYGEQKDAQRPVMVGLAAPQIGISKRIILVDIKANGKGNVGDMRVFINPEIIDFSTDINEWYEGCYSTSRVCGIVDRPTHITIKALNQDGEYIEESYEGYTARIFQHEIDHLNGTVFVDLISDDNKLHWVEEDEFPEYRNNEKWRTWTKKCSREKWNQIKGLHSRD